MATRPASIPLQAIVMSGFPNLSHQKNIAVAEPKMAARFVLIATTEIRRSVAPSVEPGLKPIQPKSRMKVPVTTKTMLCAGKARFTQYPTVFFPQTVEAYALQARTFLAAESIEVPDEFRQNARRFLYYQLYKTSLPFNRFLDTGYAPSMTRFTEFSWRDLLPENSAAIQTILDGILEGGEFLLP